MDLHRRKLHNLPNLPVEVSSAALRPLAFRIFTQKHNLTLTSNALNRLAQAVGAHCGNGWRRTGTAEKFLDQIARAWKQNAGKIVVDTDTSSLSVIVDRISIQRSVDEPKAKSEDSELHSDDRRSDSSKAVQVNSGLYTEQDAAQSRHDQQYTPQVLDAFDAAWDQRPTRDRQHSPLRDSAVFLRSKASCKTSRQRYDVVLKRLRQNPMFAKSVSSEIRGQKSTVNIDSSSSRVNTYEITKISNLLGRDGSTHVVLGILSRNPAGALTLSDLTGSISLDLQYMKQQCLDDIFLSTGMYVVADGQYEASSNEKTTALAANKGVGGNIGGTFYVFSLTSPPCDLRSPLQLGAPAKNDKTSDNITNDPTTVRQSCILFMGQLLLDNVETLYALRKVLTTYETNDAGSAISAIVFTGDYAAHGSITGEYHEGGSIRYKELFDALAATLSELSSFLRKTKFIIIPGRNDPWASCFSRGAPVCLPQSSIPDYFITRLRRTFTAAPGATKSMHRAELGTGGVLNTTNPAKIRCGAHDKDIMIFRGDICARLQRNSLMPDQSDKTSHEAMPPPDRTERLDPEDEQPEALRLARKIVRTIFDQGTLTPFPKSQNPVHEKFGSSLSLECAPKALVLSDSHMKPFVVNIGDRQVMNTGTLLNEARKNSAQWVEMRLPDFSAKVLTVQY